MMNSVNELLHDRAAEWVARMDGDTWTDADECELQRWLASDERNPGALLVAQAAWHSLDADQDVAAEPLRRFDRRGLMAGGAAALAASLAAGWMWTGLGTTYETAVGEIRRQPLEDGSMVAINTASRLKVHFGERRRKIRIAEGEAWFDVAKDPDRPFLVETGNVRVRAVGTAFAVRRREGGAEIMMTEGTAQVWATTSRSQRLFLTVGQRAFVSDSAVIELLPEDAAAVRRDLAWRTGKIELEGQSVANAVEEINRYNQRKIVLTDSMLGAERIDGIFRINDPAAFAIAMQSSFNIPVDLSDPNVIRLGSALS